MFDAVNAIDGGYEPYLDADFAASGRESAELAAGSAAHDVLIALFPDQAATFDATLDADLEESSGESVDAALNRSPRSRMMVFRRAATRRSSCSGETLLLVRNSVGPRRRCSCCVADGSSSACEVSGATRTLHLSR